jgi:hypothetical protein
MRVEEALKFKSRVDFMLWKSVDVVIRPGVSVSLTAR